MKFRRILSVLLAAVIVISCAVVAGSVVASGAGTETAAVSAYQDMLAQTSAEQGYGLAPTVNEGTILQAWNWSFKNIESLLPTLAEQGFTTVQVSPPNEIKKGTKGAKVIQSDNQNGWWMFYQPAGFQLNESTDNALGTKSEFVSMCSKAHEYGIKIIVDAVINHMGTKDNDDYNTSSDPMSHVTPRAKDFEPEIYNNKLFHSPWEKMTYKEDPGQFSQYESTYDLTRNCTSGLPDLKTEDPRVQTAIYDYLDELIAAGADGFRFDAAKHIETSEDIGDLASDFWENTLGKVRAKYSDREVYAYGEILNNCGVNRPFSMYTKLFDVTDSSSYWGIYDAATNGGGDATPYYPNSNFTAENTILWDESHDTYENGGTSYLNVVQRGKIWALCAGRANITTVYLARPDDNAGDAGYVHGRMESVTIGDAKMTSWSNATTKAINQFHNYFIGQSEYCTSNQNNWAYIERGKEGVIIVRRGSGTSGTVSLTNHVLTPGTYTDAITGNTFTVTAGKISGKVGNTGVACVYKSDIINPATEPTTVTPTEKPTVYGEGKLMGDVDDDDKVTVIDATRIQRVLASIDQKTAYYDVVGDVDQDQKVTIIDATVIQRFLASLPNTNARINVRVGGGSGQPVVNPTQPAVQPTTAPVDPSPYDFPTEDGYYTVIFTNSEGWEGSINLYYWSDGGSPLEWPGEAMEYYDTNEFGQSQYIGFVPTECENFLMNCGDGSTQSVDCDVVSHIGVYLDHFDEESGKWAIGTWEL
jgi:alpha-amylase